MLDADSVAFDEAELLRLFARAKKVKAKSKTDDDSAGDGVGRISLLGLRRANNICMCRG
jgi:hypothetical protein